MIFETVPALKLKGLVRFDDLEDKKFSDVFYEYFL